MRDVDLISLLQLPFFYFWFNSVLYPCPGSTSSPRRLKGLWSALSKIKKDVRKGFAIWRPAFVAFASANQSPYEQTEWRKRIHPSFTSEDNTRRSSPCIAWQPNTEWPPFSQRDPDGKRYPCKRFFCLFTYTFIPYIIEKIKRKIWKIKYLLSDNAWNTHYSYS